MKQAHATKHLKVKEETDRHAQKAKIKRANRSTGEATKMKAKAEELEAKATCEAVSKGNAIPSS